MKKDRMEYLLCRFIHLTDALLNESDYFNYDCTYDMLKEIMDDNEMRELGLDIEYLKGC